MASKVARWVDKYGDEHTTKAQAEAADLQIDIADIISAAATKADIDLDTQPALGLANVLIRTDAWIQIGKVLRK